MFVSSTWDPLLVTPAVSVHAKEDLMTSGRRSLTVTRPAGHLDMGKTARFPHRFHDTYMDAASVLGLLVHG